QAQVQSVDLDPTDFQLLAQQRQDLDPQRNMLHGSERLGTKARGIAQTRGTELERYPGEYRELDLAGQGELAAGRILDRARDTVLVVVWIDEQPYAQQHPDEEGEQSAHHDSNEFQGAHR